MIALTMSLTKALIVLSLSLVTAGAEDIKKDIGISVHQSGSMEDAAKEVLEKTESAPHQANFLWENSMSEYANMTEEEFGKMAEEATRPLRAALYALIEEQEKAMQAAADKDPAMKFYMDMYGYGKSDDHPDKILAKTGVWPTKFTDVTEEGEDSPLPTKLVEAKQENTTSEVTKKEKVPEILAGFHKKSTAEVDSNGNVRTTVRAE